MSPRADGSMSEMTDADLLGLATEHAAASLPSLPVVLIHNEDGTTSKRPVTRGRHGYLDATVDIDEFLLDVAVARRVGPDLAAGRPWCLGVGVVPGDGGAIVLDCDVKHGGAGLQTLEMLKARYGEEIEAVRWRSISGGVNLALRKPARLIGNTTPKDWIDIDVRADSGFVVAPGTWTPWGEWAWEQGEWADMSVMPEDMAGALPEASSDGEAVSPAARHELVAFLAASPRSSAPAAEALFESKLAELRATTTGNRHPKLVEVVGWTLGMKALNLDEAMVAIDTVWGCLLAPDEARRRADEAWEIARWVLPLESAKRERESDEPVEPCTLADAEAVFARWLGTEYDLDALRVVLATAAVERLDGDPLWLLVISGSGNAKTETVQALTRVPGALVTSTITSVGALLSATSRKERTPDATGGLLRKIGDHGVVVIKDVTSILSMDRNARAEVLAALREVYDGRWERNVGTDGGRSLTWEGRIAVVGAVTTAWDKAHAVISSMGDRFVLLRMDSRDGRMQAGRRSLGNIGSETAMRDDLASAMAGVIAWMSYVDTQLTAEESDVILAAADLVTMARTAVEYDYAGNVIDAHAPEMPTRFAKQLGQVLRGAVAIGIPRNEGLRLAIRCARDSMPPIRLAIIDDLTAHPHSTTTDVRIRLEMPRTTIDRQLQSLHMLGLLRCSEGSGVGGGWRYSITDGFNPGVLQPELVTRFVGNPTQEH